MCFYINNGICLDIIHIRVLQAELMAASVCRADDTSRYCVLKGKRASHSHHELPWSQVWWTAEQKHRQRSLK